MSKTKNTKPPVTRLPSFTDQNIPVGYIDLQRYSYSISYTV